MRTFIAIEIPEEIKRKIIEIQDKLPEFDGKKTEYENLHLTLKFLGEVDEKKIEQVKIRLREIKFHGFYVQLDKTGFFDNQDRGVIWIHATNCDDLQKEIDSQLEGLFEKEKRFMSHLTIARTKYVRDKKKFLQELNGMRISPLEFQVKDFVLKQSIPIKQRHVYEDIERYDLIG